MTAHLHLARTVAAVISIGIAAAWVTQELSASIRVREELAQCVDLLELEHEAGAVCLDVLGSCVEGVGDLLEVHELDFPAAHVVLPAPMGVAP